MDIKKKGLFLPLGMEASSVLNFLNIQANGNTRLHIRCLMPLTTTLTSVQIVLRKAMPITVSMI